MNNLSLLKNVKFPLSLALIENYKIKGIINFNCKNNTRFQAASISKTLTTLLVLRLVQEGKIDFNEEVNKYLNNYKIKNSHKKEVKMTLKQLLSHTAGINVSGFPGYSLKEKIP